MRKRNGFPTKSTRPAPMRSLLLKDLPETVQVAIKKRAWRDDISYEKAAVELLADADIARSVAHDLALMDKWHRIEEEGWF